MRHHRLDNLKRSNSLCHSRSLSDAMGGDIFAVLRHELCNLKCQLETCPSSTQEIAAAFEHSGARDAWVLGEYGSSAKWLLSCLRKQWHLKKLSYWEIQFARKERKGKENSVALCFPLPLMPLKVSEAISLQSVQCSVLWNMEQSWFKWDFRIWFLCAAGDSDLSQVFL